MALHPDVQKKAQAELDAVVGSDRLPDFTDQGSLLYLNALTKEVLRWHAVAPIGVPHRSVDDDFYKDSLIPGGSIVMANQWSVHAPAPERMVSIILLHRALSRDESLYPDPEHFSPERFLHDDESTPDAKNPFNYAFGFGRRYAVRSPIAVCIGGLTLLSGAVRGRILRELRCSLSVLRSCMHSRSVRP